VSAARVVSQSSYVARVETAGFPAPMSFNGSQFTFESTVSPQNTLPTACPVCRTTLKLIVGWLHGSQSYSLQMNTAAAVANNGWRSDDHSSLNSGG
jgi:hypothetical protein